NPDRTKMSKRKSQTALDAYRAEGFIKEAIDNFLAFLGWSVGTDEEIFTLEELGERFTLERVQSSGAVFDRARLEWFNGQWIRRLTDEALADRLLPFLSDEIRARAPHRSEVRTPTPDDVLDLLPLVRERLPTLSAVGSLVDYLFIDPIYVDPALLVP